jgi:inner membrane transporter RhtA
MSSSRRLTLPPVASILLAVFSVQGGATIAKGLFPVVGAAGTAAIRIGLSAVILVAVFRPPVHRLTAAQWRAVVPYGVSIGVMNLVFYQALVRIPLGLAVTLEFVGPLGVAIVSSRRALDGMWVALAAIGIALITPWQAGSAAGSVDPLGVAIALVTGGCWAAYIVLGGRVSRVLTGSVAVATGMSIATLTVLPIALAGGRLGSFAPHLYAAGVAVAVLSSALPFTLEMHALGAPPGRTFSILMSLEPAVAALCGLVLLGEHLTTSQWLAVGLVIAASVGATVTAREVPVHVEV